MELLGKVVDGAQKMRKIFRGFSPSAEPDVEPTSLPALESQARLPWRSSLLSFRPSRRGLIWAGVVCLMATLAAELVLSMRHHSPTWNEPDHILAGYRYWQVRDLGINSEHPPLVKWLAAAPLLRLPLNVPQVPRRTSKWEANVAGRRFLSANHADVLLRARLAASVLTLLLGALLFEAASGMFGPEPALLALALFVFEPNSLAHGALVTTDMGLACCLFAAVYAFYRYVKQSSALRLVECGFMTGLVFAAKHSGILVIPILAALAAAEVLMGRRPLSGPGPTLRRKLASRGRHALRLAAACVAMGVIAVGVLWSFYAFRFQARPDNLKMTPSLADYVKEMNHPIESRIILGLERRRVLPESYLYGLADVLMVSAGPRPAFLFGKLYLQGRWFYFPAVFLIKSTLGFLALLLLTLAAKTLSRPEVRREFVFLTLPPVLYFAFSLTRGLNVGVRHILPVYPFLLVLAGAGAWTLVRRQGGWAYVVPVFIALHVVSSLRAYPDYLAYSNEAWGGPAKTYRVLTDSNVDWGQDLVATKRYLDEHRIRDCWMAYFGSADPGDYKIPCKLLPDPFAVWWGKSVDVVPQVAHGTVLISATEAAGTFWGPGELNPYEQFLKARPVENLGGSILVFDGRFDLSLASALSHAWKAGQLAERQELDQALAEARVAVALAPRSVSAHNAFGYTLTQAKQTAAARRAYQTALSLAQTVYPEYQTYWIPFLQNALNNR